jgi:hypothetical protein
LGFVLIAAAAKVTRLQALAAKSSTSDFRMSAFTRGYGDARFETLNRVDDEDIRMVRRERK